MRPTEQTDQLKTDLLAALRVARPTLPVSWPEAAQVQEGVCGGPVVCAADHDTFRRELDPFLQALPPPSGLLPFPVAHGTPLGG